MGIFSASYELYQQKIKRKLFFDITKNNKIDLNYENNIEETDILREIFYDRCYADYFPFYQKSVIVDIGAHKGYFSIFASRNSAPSSRIISLEPFNDNVAVMKTNLKDNNISNVEILQKGIYSTNTEIELFLSKSENNSVFSNYNKYLKNENIDEVKIEVISIEKLIDTYKLEKIDFMKIDCEGAEYPALLTSDKYTLDKIKTLSIEFHDLKDENYNGLKLVEHLEKNGFEIVKFIHEPTTINNNFGKIIAIK